MVVKFLRWANYCILNCRLKLSRLFKLFRIAFFWKGVRDTSSTAMLPGGWSPSRAPPHLIFQFLPHLSAAAPHLARPGKSMPRLLEPAQEDRCLLRVGRVMPATATNRCPICVLDLYRYSTLDFPMCLAYSSLFPSIQSFPLVLGFRSSTFIRSGCCFYFIGLLIWISF